MDSFERGIEEDMVQRYEEGFADGKESEAKIQNLNRMVVTVPTFTATIYVGFRERSTSEVVFAPDVVQKIQDYVDVVGLCVTYNETRFIYTNGSEPGCVVGLINYPRFPSAPEQIKSHAIAIAGMLLKACKQLKVSIVMPDETVMITARGSAS